MQPPFRIGGIGRWRVDWRGLSTLVVHTAGTRVSRCHSRPRRTASPSSSRRQKVWRYCFNPNHRPKASPSNAPVVANANIPAVPRSNAAASTPPATSASAPVTGMRPSRNSVRERTGSDRHVATSGDPVGSTGRSALCIESPCSLAVD